jgi:hypothetical protein
MPQPTEEWRVSPTVPRYEVSSYGRVRVIPYYAAMPNGRGVRLYTGDPKIGHWQEDEKRYVLVICDKTPERTTRTYRIAQLICEAFHGPRPFPEAVAMHLNENSRINRADNVGWGTQKENLNAPGFLAYCGTRVGMKHPKAKRL